MLAKVLANQLGEPVENATRITGSFDSTLQWRPDAAGVPDDGPRASLFTAIREQLGLHSTRAASRSTLSSSTACR